ncbi:MULTISPECIES: hypothetical protein [unclassified Acinetobacter]|uniref:hypothetical protein n=1 Tax=unclassified Acinetobacter TaxID=196816 RepID=UPI00244904A8|nr:MULTISPECIES: hypothetical protein [unclassified Acinetobacter]MDH0030037.1 hypothetical protein [Acinetobacter sp. GD04021]MDH0885131.1 hypothetical protein [Acinetobacter sp. GD03873]MDH1082225.1 hypothetical protein [Acinetobacter sp. GD03983]MDH2188428.1 hypothetical protein [Acinetobacter sp. GD03645]MDH2202049.1 hypothetical protein [Acinetobacter sp. GD03647]
MLKKSLLSACIAASVLLTACHDDDDQQSNVSPTPTITYSDLAGTAAVGAAIKNASVTASCKDGSGFKNEVKTNEQGEWSGQVDSTKLPCALEVKASDTQTLHGYAAKAGNVNITPFTDLALALASSQTPSDWYKTYQPILETTLKTAVDNLTKQLKADGYQLPENFDLLTTKFAIDDAFDKALDAFAASLAANQATIKDYAALIEKVKAGDVAALPDAAPANPTTDPKVSGPLTAASASNTTEFLNALKKDDYYLKVESSFGGAATEFPVGSIHKVGITKEGNVTIQGKTQAFTYSYRQHTLSDFHSNALTFYNAAGTGVELYISYDPATGYLTVEPQGMAGGEGGVKLVSNKGTATTPTQPTNPTQPTEPSTSDLCESNGADDKLGFKNAPQDFCSFSKASTTVITSPDIYTFFNADKKQNVKVTISGTAVKSIQLENDKYAWACGVGTTYACTGAVFTKNGNTAQVTFQNALLEAVSGTTQALTVKNGALIYQDTNTTNPTTPTTSQVSYKTAACSKDNGNGMYGNCGASTISDFTDTIPASPSGTYAACTITKTSDTITVKQTTKKGENLTVSAKLDGGLSDTLYIKSPSLTVIANDTTVSNGTLSGPSITVSITNGQVVQVNTQVYANSGPTSDGLIVCTR